MTSPSRSSCQVLLAVPCFADGRADEPAFDSADGFPADATLTSQSGRCSNPSLPGVPASALATARGCARRLGGHGESGGWTSPGRSFAKGETDAFVAPCEWQWSQWRKQQGGDDGGDDLFVRLLENCLGRLLRADVCRPVQGNLFPRSSVSLGRPPTTQIP